MRDDGLWERAKALAGEQGLSGLIAKLLRDWVQKEEARESGADELELWVGGDMYQADHDDPGPLHIAFTGRLIADSEGLARDAIPAIRIYQTRTGKLVAYRDWRGKPGVEGMGATYLTFPDLQALAASPHAVDTYWVTGDAQLDGDRPDLRRRLLRQAAEAMGEPLVIRID